MILHKLIAYMTDRTTHERRWVDALETTDVLLSFVWGMLDPISGVHIGKRIASGFPPRRSSRSTTWAIGRRSKRPSGSSPPCSPMTFALAPAVAADAAAVTEIVAALESVHYDRNLFSQADLEDEWSELDLVRDGDRIVGYCAAQMRRDVCQTEGYVRPGAPGRGIGRLIATGLEEEAIRRGARRITTASSRSTRPPASRLSRSATAPCAPSATCASSSRRRRPHRDGPTGCASSHSIRTAMRDFHAAQEEAFADAWDHTPRAFDV